MLMQPSLPPAGPVHDADPAHPNDFCSAFFAIAFSNAFFMMFGSHLGAQNRPKLDFFLKRPRPGAICS